MELVEVRGQLTLEQTGVSFELGLKEIIRMSKADVREDERNHYSQLFSDVFIVSKQTTEDTDRQFYVAYPPERGTKLHCISFVQVLLGRGQENRVVVAVLRSSSTRRLAGDLGLLSRIALSYDCARLRVTIGSLHVELDPAEFGPEELHADAT